jgi:hypothetical protein
MKNTSITLMALIALASSTGFAREEAKGHPCHEIKKACQAAGFYKGGHKKGQEKGLYKDCFQDVLEGKSVPGVTVSSDVVTACKAKKDAHDAAQK